MRGGVYGGSYSGADAGAEQSVERCEGGPYSGADAIVGSSVRGSVQRCGGVWKEEERAAPPGWRHDPLGRRA